MLDASRYRQPKTLPSIPLHYDHEERHSRLWNEGLLQAKVAVCMKYAFSGDRSFYMLAAQVPVAGRPSVSSEPENLARFCLQFA